METRNNRVARATFNILTLALGIAGAVTTPTVISISPDSTIHKWRVPVQATAAIYAMTAITGSVLSGAVLSIPFFI